MGVKTALSRGKRKYIFMSMQIILKRIEDSQDRGWQYKPCVSLRDALEKALQDHRKLMSLRWAYFNNPYVGTAYHTGWDCNEGTRSLKKEFEIFLGNIPEEWDKLTLGDFL